MSMSLSVALFGKCEAFVVALLCPTATAEYLTVVVIAPIVRALAAATGAAASARTTSAQIWPQLLPCVCDGS